MRERARLASVALPHAGDWLVVAPLAALGLHLRPAEFVLVVKYRLGLAVFDQAGPCPACLRPSDTLGDHAMCCGTGGERIARHNHLRDAVFDTAVAAGLGPVKEGTFLLPGCDRRPADVLLPNWAQGRDAALDVTVVTPLQQEIENKLWNRFDSPLIALGALRQFCIILPRAVVSETGGDGLSQALPRPPVSSPPATTSASKGATTATPGPASASPSTTPSASTTFSFTLSITHQES